MYVVAKPYTDPGMQKKLEWVARMLGASKASAAKIGCSPEAIVAQAAQETGWGRSAIGNNVFGIKASSGWKGAVVMRPTWEVENGAVVHIVAPFRDYSTLADGIEDHRHVAAGIDDGAHLLLLVEDQRAVLLEGGHRNDEGLKLCHGGSA